MKLEIIKKYIKGAFKKYKNREYREKIKKEKAKKYMFSSGKNKENSFILKFSKNKKKFSNIFSKIDLTNKKYKFYYFGIGILLIILSVYVLILSPYFRISPSKVIIERLDTITDINISYKAIEKIYGQSIFLVSNQEIIDLQKNYQKNINKITVDRLYPNGLKIIISSYPPDFYTQFGNEDKKYVITSNGILVYEKNIDSKLNLVDIVDNEFIENGFFDYKQAISSDTMKKIIYLKKLFSDIFPKKNIAKFVYFKKENEIHLIMETGTKLIIELNNSIANQIALLKYYNDNNKDILSSGDIDYVDIRIKSKIYVCTDKNLCNKNLSRIYKNYYK